MAIVKAMKKKARFEADVRERSGISRSPRARPPRQPATIHTPLSSPRNIARPPPICWLRRRGAIRGLRDRRPSQTTRSRSADGAPVDSSAPPLLGVQREVEPEDVHSRLAENAEPAA